MDKELKEIVIFTARFVEYQTEKDGEKDFVLGDERVVLDVMVDKGVINPLRPFAPRPKGNRTLRTSYSVK